MKAIQHFYSGANFPPVIHFNIIEIEKRNSNKEFMCMDCRCIWTENINSPQIISDETIKEYYPNVKSCNDIIK